MVGEPPLRVTVQPRLAAQPSKYIRDFTEPDKNRQGVTNIEPIANCSTFMTTQRMQL